MWKTIITISSIIIIAVGFWVYAETQVTSQNIADTLIVNNATSTDSMEVGACTGSNIDFTGGDACILDDLEVEGIGYLANVIF